MQQEIGNRILNILIEEGKPVSGRGLALRCDISVNTVRKEIEEINKEAARHGFSIESRASVGHYISISDPDRAQPYLNEQYHRYLRSRYIPDEFSQSVMHVLRRVLCSKRPVPQERLCEELYCSRSTLARYADKAKKALERFGLRLVNIRNEGFSVAGDEWDIRQCLIFLHKVLAITNVDLLPSEYDFRNSFFMDKNDSRYIVARKIFAESLSEQDDFFIPMVDIPKIINYFLLSVSRRVYKINFTDAQKAETESTREYEFVKHFREKLRSCFNTDMQEGDVYALTMLLLSYESINRHLEELEIYGELEKDYEDILGKFPTRWHLPEEAADDNFKADCMCYLYTIRNRQIFGVFNDAETASFIDSKSVRTADMCIDFSHSYEQRHGFKIGDDEKFGMYHLFHRLADRYPGNYYALDILFVSRYGIQYSRAEAERLKRRFDKEIRSITVREFAEVTEDDFLDYDLLVTDADPKALSSSFNYQLPTVFINPNPASDGCPELEEYFDQIRREAELSLIMGENFRYTSFKDKEDVFSFFADEFCFDETSRRRIKKDLKQNDEFALLEKENGVVFLPILYLREEEKPRICVAINDTPLKWSSGRSWIFVCYIRSDAERADFILDDLLRRFLRISIEQTELLISNNTCDPMEIIFGK